MRPLEKNDTCAQQPYHHRDERTGRAAHPQRAHSKACLLPRHPGYISPCLSRERHPVANGGWCTLACPVLLREWTMAADLWEL